MNRQQRRQAERQALKATAPSLHDHRQVVDLGTLRPGGDQGKGAVVVGYLTGGHPAPEFLMSLMGMLRYETQTGGAWAQPGAGEIALRTSPRVAEGRTQMVNQFLTTALMDEAQWLLMLDDDMDFDSDLCTRLLESASYPERPVVGGLCFAGGHYRQQWPTVYEAYQLEGGGYGVRPTMTYPKDQLVKVGATGAACLLVHRQVYLGMAAAPWNQEYAPGIPNPYPWFVEGAVTPDGAPLGEDIAFCRKLTRLGIPIHIDTRVKLGHMKTAPLTEATFEGQMVEQAEAVARHLTALAGAGA